jgi:hypothetical protein
MEGVVYLITSLIILKYQANHMEVLLSIVVLFGLTLFQYFPYITMTLYAIPWQIYATLIGSLMTMIIHCIEICKKSTD